MKPLPFVVALLFPALALPSGADRGAEIILEANFDDKTVNEPIGLGGAIVGEPVSVNSTVSATVKDWPLDTPNLKINDVDLFDPGYVRFEFLNQYVITHGTLVISANVWFQAYEEYVFRVRELRARSKKFLDLTFGSTGTMRYSDENSPVITPIAYYEVGRLIPLVITFDLDAGTYDVEWDGQLVLDDEPHGVDVYGIGALLFGMLADEDNDGEFNLDDLVVTATEVPTPVAPRSWAGTKAAYR